MVDIAQTQKNASPAWSPAQWRFIELLASPEVGKSGKTQAELAIELGVRAETLSRWKKLPGFADAVYALAMQHAGARMGKVIASLGDAAEKEDNIQAKRLYLEAMGKVKPASAVQNIINADARVQPASVADVLERLAPQERPKWLIACRLAERIPSWMLNGDEDEAVRVAEEIALVFPGARLGAADTVTATDAAYAGLVQHED
jgi:hypothetical protein